MLCLGIETSCDETALALVENGRLTASILSSQADVHALFGGVVPELASREHARLIGPLYDALGLEGRAPDVVAFARGPGLLGSLLVGAGFAKALALGFGARIIGINHLHAHLLAAGLEEPLRFPALGLLVSGGHTHIYRIESPQRFILLGTTLDDAAGEAFDKVGKLLGLPYPAGRLIDELSRSGRVVSGMFRPPYIDNDNLNFSFSGLKTAASLYIEQHPELRQQSRNTSTAGQDTANFCASLNQVVAATLKVKFERAFQSEQGRGIRSFILAGGVAANSAVRMALRECADQAGLPLAVPSPGLCTDNGSMIAYTGWLLAKEGFAHDFGVSCIPRGTPIPDDLIRMTGTRAEENPS